MPDRVRDSYLDHLAEVPLFSACSRKDLRKIARASDEVALPAGRIVVEEGDSAHEFFLILEGTATVRRSGRKVAQLGVGQYFGELSLLGRGPRTATVIADTDIDMLVIRQRQFLHLIDEIPGLAYKLLRIMAERLREADRKNVGH